jgi:anti-sigma-K factor RskA
MAGAIQRHHWPEPGVPDLGFLTPLTEFLRPAPPPARLLARIEREIDADVRARALAAVRAAQSHGRWQLLGAGAVGAMAAAVVLTLVANSGPAGIGQAGRLDSGDPVPVASLASPDGGRLLRAEMVSNGRFLRLAHTGPPIPARHALELWLIPAGAGMPQSLGLLTAKGAVTILPLAMALNPGDVLAVSEEPAGGSRLAGPTGQVLMSAVIGRSG